MMTKLTPPSWAKDAIPTVKGWTKPIPKGKLGHPELLVSTRISQVDIDEYLKPTKAKKKPKTTKPKAPKKKAEPKVKGVDLTRPKKVETVTKQTQNDTPTMLTEAPTSAADVHQMNEADKKTSTDSDLNAE